MPQHQDYLFALTVALPIMVYAIVSQKGGTGKSSTAISLAAGLAHQGMPTLLVDINSQANSSKVLLPNYPELDRDKTVFRIVLERKALPIHSPSVKNRSIVPSHILLFDTDGKLTTAIDHREARLKTELDRIKDGYAYVFIDCPPALSWLTINAFTAANQVIVAVSPGYFELDSIVQISKTIKEVQDVFSRGLELLGFLFTMSNPTINTRTSLQVLRQTYTDKVLKTIIPRNSDLRDPNAKAARLPQVDSGVI